MAIIHDIGYHRKRYVKVEQRYLEVDAGRSDVEFRSPFNWPRKAESADD